jgi:hypothetical protein
MHTGSSLLSRIALIALLVSCFQVHATPPSSSLISPKDKAALEAYIQKYSGFNERTKNEQGPITSSSKKYWIAGGILGVVIATILITASYDEKTGAWSMQQLKEFLKNIFAHSPSNAPVHQDFCSEIER